MSLDIRPAMPMPLRRRVGVRAGHNRFTQLAVTAAVTLTAFVAVVSVGAVALMLGLT
jgi:hypothetical protein